MNIIITKNFKAKYFRMILVNPGITSGYLKLPFLIAIKNFALHLTPLKKNITILA